MTRRMRAGVADSAQQAIGIRRIAAAVGSDPQACDAARLAETIARVAGADLMLVTVRPRVPAAVPEGTGKTMAEVEAWLQALRAEVSPSAHVAVETDHSVAPGLARVVTREGTDLVVLGSSPRAPEGRVRIGRRTRQLLRHLGCPLAVAPRGLCGRDRQQLAVVGVGYDGTAESSEALTRAASLARAAGAQLRVRAVVDDRLPYAGWTPTGGPDLYEIWDAVIEPDVESLREKTERALPAAVADAVVETVAGCPPDELIALSREVDLLVVGSGRWGAGARILLGSTGEELMHDSRCSVMIVPRPSNSADADREPACPR